MAKTDKLLILYFSRTGNTKALARHIGLLLDAPVCALEPETPYPENWFSCVGEALKEKRKGIRPAMKTPVLSPEKYDRILLAFPIWAGVCPNLILTFFDTYREILRDKEIYPCCTYSSKKMPKKIVDYLRKNGAGKIHGCYDGNNLNEEAIRYWLGMEPIERSNH